MTRGKMFLITDTKILQSCEFNGGCYLEGDGALGPDILEGLRNADTEEEFKDFLVYFSQENYKYNNELCYDITEEVAQDKKFWNMGENYYDKFFSDYIYIKNASDEEVKINTDNCYLYLKKGDTIITWFGSFTNDCKKYSDDIKIDVNEKIIEIIKQQGWGVQEDGDEIYIEDWMRGGEDMIVCCNKNSIIKDIKEYSDDYDPDKHARENIKGGDPRPIQTIIDDANKFADKLDDLCNALKGVEIYEK